MAFGGFGLSFAEPILQKRQISLAVPVILQSPSRKKRENKCVRSTWACKDIRQTLRENLFSAVIEPPLVLSQCPEHQFYLVKLG